MLQAPARQRPRAAHALDRRIQPQGNQDHRIDRRPPGAPFHRANALADNTYLKSAVENSEAVLGSTAAEISADGAYYSEHNEAYAKEQDKEIHYTGFPGRAGRYDYERSEEGVVVSDRVSGERADRRGIQAGALPLPCRGQLALHHRQRHRRG